jgi:hypothetical protein
MGELWSIRYGTHFVVELIHEAVGDAALDIPRVRRAAALQLLRRNGIELGVAAQITFEKAKACETRISLDRFKGWNQAVSWRLKSEGQTGEIAHSLDTSS